MKGTGWVYSFNQTVLNRPDFPEILLRQEQPILLSQMIRIQRIPPQRVLYDLYRQASGL